jgi:hypothetical protein
MDSDHRRDKPRHPGGRCPDQRRPEGSADFEPPCFLLTDIRPVLGSTDQTITSPGATSSRAATAAGTVVRTDADRSRARTARVSNVRVTRERSRERIRPEKRLGRYVGRPEARNLIYARCVGQTVGQHVSDEKPRPSARERRALEWLQAGGAILETSTPGEYIVPSHTGKGSYRVKGIGIEGVAPECTCIDFAERFTDCKHIFEAKHWLAAGDAPASTTIFFPAPPPKRSAVNWTAYSQAQADEGRLFGLLLRGLCEDIPEIARDPHKAGRPPIPLADQAFCAIQKVYSGFSCRRSQEFRRISAEKGHIAKAPYWDVPSKFLCREDAEGILQDLLTCSALPLVPLESVGIIDLTGFRTTSFHHYRHERYTPDRKNFWLTGALMVGQKSHGVLGANVAHGVMGDAPQFEPLLRRVKAAGFQIKEVLADKAFNSRVNFDVAAELGVEAYIPFKSNATGKSFGSSTYHKMFLFFTYYREKFDEHYRQRVQVESAIGAAKQKIGETVWSKNFAAQLNELLAKLVAYNITVLIRAMYETGLVPDIFAPPDGCSRAALEPPFPRVVA